MQDVYNTVPFILQNDNYKVEIADALSADILDMDVISDEFKPSAPTITDHIWGFFTGIIIYFTTKTQKGQLCTNLHTLFVYFYAANVCREVIYHRLFIKNLINKVLFSTI